MCNQEHPPIDYIEYSRNDFNTNNAQSIILIIFAISVIICSHQRYLELILIIIFTKAVIMMTIAITMIVAK